MPENNFEFKEEIKYIREVETPSRKDQETNHDLQDDEKLGWLFYDSPLESFDDNFRKVLPENIQSINDYVKNIYQNKKSQLIGIELGGPGKKLFAELVPEYFAKTAGFTLHNRGKAKGKSNHKVIEADVFCRRKKGDIIPGYQAVEKWIKDNGKADIIIEKMVAPIDRPSIRHLTHIVKRWYKLLSSGGTLFLELPIYSNASKIAAFLGKYPGLFDYQIDKSGEDGSRYKVDGVYVRVRKLDGAPDSIDELLRNENLE